MDAFWLPGIEGFAVRTQTFGRAPLAVPDLAPRHLELLAARLIERRRAVLARRTTAAILAALEQVAERFRDRRDPLRRAAEEWLPAVTGYAPAMIAAGLRAQVDRAGRRSLEALLHAELPEGALDGPVPHPGGRGWTRAVGPDLTGLVFSGNVPGVPAYHLAVALLARSAALAKTARGEPLFAALWCRGLAEVDPELGECVAAAYWPGEAAELHRAAFARAGAVVSFGSDAALDALQAQLPAGTRHLRHGSKLSFGCIAREALARPTDVADVAWQAARDVALYDQQGCVSPHTFLVEEGGAVAPSSFAAVLGEQLARLEATWPRAALPPEAAAAIQVARSEARFGAPGTLVWASPGSTAWTVVYRPEPALVATPLNRFAAVCPVPDLGAAVELARPWAGRLQTVTYAGPRERALDLAGALAPLGVSRICPLGRAQEPGPAWRHDGALNLLPLLHWVDIEE